MRGDEKNATIKTGRVGGNYLLFHILFETGRGKSERCFGAGQKNENTKERKKETTGPGGVNGGQRRPMTENTHPPRLGGDSALSLFLQ